MGFQNGRGTNKSNREITLLFCLFRENVIGMGERIYNITFRDRLSFSSDWRLTARLIRDEILPNLYRISYGEAFL
jgi:hypothetical protein